MIESDEALARLVEELRGAPEIALDCEFHGEGRYLPQLCLLQVGAGDRVEAIDPERVDLAPLGPLLADPSLPKLFHAGGQDLPILQRATGQTVRGVFDTQVAAAFVGHGASIAYARLVEKLCGVALSKASRFTDWQRRPLSPEQLAYALDDVRYLPRVARLLRADLETRGRLPWAEAACAAATEKALTPRDPRALYLRLGPFSGMSRRQLATLREVAAWRDARAAARDRPLGSIAIDEALRQVAMQPPSDARGVGEIRGLRDVEKGAVDLLAAIARARALPDEDCPPLPRREADPRVDGAAALLAAALRARAGELDLAPSLLAHRDEVHALAAWHFAGRPDPAPALGLLDGWQRDAAGAQLLALLDGRAAVRLDAGAPEGLRVVEIG